MKIHEELIPASHEPEEVIWLDEPGDDYDYGIDTNDMDETDELGE